MILLLLEVLVVLAIAVGIVWWTMFSGRKKDAPIDKNLKLGHPERKADRNDGDQG